MAMLGSPSRAASNCGTVVAVRSHSRNLSASESSAEERQVISVLRTRVAVDVDQIVGSERLFDVDHCFQSHDPTSSSFANQRSVATVLKTDLFETARQGHNVCLLTYGQSLTGKTHTMFGTHDDPGIVPLLCSQLAAFAVGDGELTSGTVGLDPMTQLSSASATRGTQPTTTQPSPWTQAFESLAHKTHAYLGHHSCRLEMSIMEVCAERVTDALSDSGNGANDNMGLLVKEFPKQGLCVPGLRRIAITGPSHAEAVLHKWQLTKSQQHGIDGTGRRKQQRLRSQKTHTVVQLTLTQTAVDKDVSTAVDTVSTVSLFDIAGDYAEDNEIDRQMQQAAPSALGLISAGLDIVSSTNKQPSTADTVRNRMEPSLCALRQCISALADNTSAGGSVGGESRRSKAGSTKAGGGYGRKRNVAVPYHDSVLTRILEPCIGGNARLMVLATVSSREVDLGETLATLAFAQRARMIRTTVTTTTVPNTKLIRVIQSNVSAVKLGLQQTGGALQAMLSPTARPLPLEENGDAAASAEWQLTNLNESLCEGERSSYALPSGTVFIVGDEDKEKECTGDESNRADRKTIHLTGVDVAREHASLQITAASVVLHPTGEGRTYVNGRRLRQDAVLVPGCRVAFGLSHIFRFEIISQTDIDGPDRRPAFVIDGGGLRDSHDSDASSATTRGVYAGSGPYGSCSGAGCVLTPPSLAAPRGSNLGICELSTALYELGLHAVSADGVNTRDKRQASTIVESVARQQDAAWKANEKARQGSAAKVIDRGTSKLQKLPCGHLCHAPPTDTDQANGNGLLSWSQRLVASLGIVGEMNYVDQMLVTAGLHVGIRLSFAPTVVGTATPHPLCIVVSLVDMVAAIRSAVSPKDMTINGRGFPNVLAAHDVGLALATELEKRLWAEHASESQQYGDTVAEAAELVAASEMVVSHLMSAGVLLRLDPSHEGNGTGGHGDHGALGDGSDGGMFQLLLDQSDCESFLSFDNAFFGFGESDHAALVVAESLLRQVIACASRGIDNGRFKSTYPLLQVATIELQFVDINKLSRSARKVFLLNIYNAMTLHARLVSCRPDGSDTRDDFSQFVSSSKYRIMTWDYSLEHIHCELTGHSHAQGRLLSDYDIMGVVNAVPSINGGDNIDPRVHFALCDCTNGGNELAIYQLDTIDAQLDAATHRAFRRVDLLPIHPVDAIVLPSVMRWYPEFGVGREQHLKFVTRMADDATVAELRERSGERSGVEHGGASVVHYQAFDYTLALNRTLARFVHRGERI